MDQIWRPPGPGDTKLACLAVFFVLQFFLRCSFFCIAVFFALQFFCVAVFFALQFFLRRRIFCVSDSRHGKPMRADRSRACEACGVDGLSTSGPLSLQPECSLNRQSKCIWTWNSNSSISSNKNSTSSHISSCGPKQSGARGHKNLAPLGGSV